MGHRKIYSAAWLLAVLVALSACVGVSSKPSRTFLLNEVAHLNKSNAIDPVRVFSKEPLRVGVGPFKIPDYLNRPQIVSQAAGNELQINEFHRWAEPLGESMPRVMAQNMSRLLMSELVFAFPWRSSLKPDHRVTVTVLRFHGSLGENVSLDGVWHLYDGSKNTLQESKRFSFTVDSKGEGFDALVDAHNHLVYLLSRQVASAIGAHSFTSSS